MSKQVLWLGAFVLVAGVSGDAWATGKRGCSRPGEARWSAVRANNSEEGRRFARPLNTAPEQINRPGYSRPLRRVLTEGTKMDHEAGTLQQVAKGMFVDGHARGFAFDGAPTVDQARARCLADQLTRAADGLDACVSNMGARVGGPERAAIERGVINPARGAAQQLALLAEAFGASETGITSIDLTQ